ncbi:hypothetical protein HOY80DRAFT_279556 [Tuber brumale]|nr:hypothetical protein HOY80DRAFT_279556 [Tuber brumale]
MMHAVFWGIRTASFVSFFCSLSLSLSLLLLLRRHRGCCAKKKGGGRCEKMRGFFLKNSLCTFTRPDFRDPLLGKSNPGSSVPWVGFVVVVVVMNGKEEEEEEEEEKELGMKNVENG